MALKQQVVRHAKNACAHAFNWWQARRPLLAADQLVRGLLFLGATGQPTLLQKPPVDPKAEADNGETWG